MPSYTLLRTFHYVDEGISSGFPFIYPRKQTIGFLFNFIYALSGASWLTRGYRHPLLHSHTLPYSFETFPEGTASTAGFIYPRLAEFVYDIRTRNNGKAMKKLDN